MNFFVVQLSRLFGELNIFSHMVIQKFSNHIVVCNRYIRNIDLF